MAEFAGDEGAVLDERDVAFKTLKSCGSSSREVARRKRPELLVDAGGHSGSCRHWHGIF